MSEKKISVVMSAYNEPERFLRESIESILNQTCRDFEFIIIQDKPDNEAIERVVNEYAAKDDRIRFYKNEKNIGLAMSLNRGIELARYDIIARMDADDIALPELLEKDLAFLTAHPEMHMVSVNYVCMDDDGATVTEARIRSLRNFGDIEKRMRHKNIVLHPGAMFYRKDFDGIGGYRNFPASQDYDLWMRYITKGWQFAILKDVLLKYRATIKNTTYSKALSQWVGEKYIKALFRERLKNGADSYSEETLKGLIQAAGGNDPKSIESYNEGRMLVFEGKKALLGHEYVTCLSKLIKAFFSHKEMPSYIVRTIRAFLVDK